MDIRQYVRETHFTAKYPEHGEESPLGLAYVALGLVGEAGEVAEQIKKALRDDRGVVTDSRRCTIVKELGDVAWYWARLHEELGLDPAETLLLNQEKLLSRRDRGVLGGSGNDR